MIFLTDWTDILRQSAKSVGLCPVTLSIDFSLFEKTFEIPPVFVCTQIIIKKKEYVNGKEKIIKNIRSSVKD